MPNPLHELLRWSRKRRGELADDIHQIETWMAIIGAPGSPNRPHLTGLREAVTSEAEHLDRLQESIEKMLGQLEP